MNRKVQKSDDPNVTKTHLDWLKREILRTNKGQKRKYIGTLCQKTDPQKNEWF